MMEDQLFQTQSKEFFTTGSLANYTFSGKTRDSIIDLKDPKAALDIEFSALKEQHKKALGELSRVMRKYKDLKSKIKQRDREINELKTQMDYRPEMSIKPKERDINQPKQTSDENMIDGKGMRSVTHENSIEKIVMQNKSLKKEVEKLSERLRRFEEGKMRDSNEISTKLSQELPTKLKIAELANESLLRRNDELNETMQQLSREASQLQRENIEIRRNYEDLKSQYDSLETTATSNKVDYSTESRANSELAISRQVSSTQKYMNDTAGFSTDRSQRSIQENNASGDLSFEEYKRIVKEIMDIYCVKSPSEVVSSVEKTEKVVQMVPKLRKVLSDIAVLVLPRAGYTKEKGQMEMIIPSIKKLCKELEEVDVLKSLKNKLIDVLELDKDCTNLDILKNVDKLAAFYYQSSELKPQNSTTKDSVEDNLLSNEFVKVFGVQPSMSVFRQITKQLDDSKHFMNTIKHKLNLSSDMKNEACLNHILKLLEGGIKDRQIMDIIYKLQCIFNCDLDSLVYTVERLVYDKRDKSYGRTRHM